MNQKTIVHGELFDDGSYHCLLSYPNDPAPVQCHAIEWSRSEFVEHLRSAHRLNVSERVESGDVLIDGEPAPIVHRSAMHERIEGEKCNYHSCLREKAFADQWEAVNASEHVLAALATRPAEKGDAGAWRPMLTGIRDDWRKQSWASPDDVDNEGRVVLYSQRDAIVAATVVQWLGTNVGFSWLEEALKKAGYALQRLPDAAHEAKAFAQVRREIDAQQVAGADPHAS